MENPVNAPAPALSRRMGVTYTRTGQKHTVTESATGTHTFVYTNALDEYTETIDGNLYDKAITRTYDSFGRPTEFQIGPNTDNPNTNYDVSYSYDSWGRFEEVETTVPSSFTATYGYVTNSNLVGTVTFPNSIVATRHYEDHRDLLDWIENKVGSTSVSKYEYTNDAAGRRTAAGWSGSAFSQGQGQGNDTIAYGYNSRSEVTSAYAQNRQEYVYEYQYDNIGNRLEYTVAGGTPTTYESNELNQYTIALDPNETFLYDDDGNLTQDGTCTYTWDGENRLVGIENAWRRAQYDYDYMGRRIRARVWYPSGGQWLLGRDVRFLYDQWNLTWEETIIPGSGTDVARYTWGLDLSGTLHGAGGVGGLLYGSGISGGASAVFYDGNGNVTELVQGTTLVAHFEYDPFGNMQMVMGSPYVPFAFSTKYWDVFVGMGDYYYGLRYYTPRLGRWTSRDPIGEEGGQNVYQAMYNDPLGMIDPMGLQSSSSAGEGGNRNWLDPCTIYLYTGHINEFLDTTGARLLRHLKEGIDAYDKSPKAKCTAAGPHIGVGTCFNNSSGALIDGKTIKQSLGGSANSGGRTSGFLLGPPYPWSANPTGYSRDPEPSIAGVDSVWFVHPDVISERTAALNTAREMLDSRCCPGGAVIRLQFLSPQTPASVSLYRTYGAAFNFIPASGQREYSFVVRDRAAITTMQRVDSNMAFVWYPVRIDNIVEAR